MFWEVEGHQASLGLAVASPACKLMHAHADQQLQLSCRQMYMLACTLQQLNAARLLSLCLMDRQQSQEQCRCTWQISSTMGSMTCRPSSLALLMRQLRILVSDAFSVSFFLFSFLCLQVSQHLLLHGRLDVLCTSPSSLMMLGHSRGC